MPDNRKCYSNNEQEIHEAVTALYELQKVLHRMHGVSMCTYASTSNVLVAKHVHYALT